MSTERIFTQKVVMPCTKEQYEKHLKDSLCKMGYVDTFLMDFKWMPYITNSYRQNTGMVADITYSSVAHDYGSYLTLPEFNADLFLALAAISSGDQYFEREPLRFTDQMPPNFGDQNRIVLFDGWIEVKPHQTNVQFFDPTVGDYFNCYPTSIRKATKEEVLGYYTIIDEQVDKIIEEVKRSFDTGDTLGKADHTNDPDFVKEYKEQSFFEENIAKELSGHTETNWVEEMEDGDNAEQILDQAKTFAYNMKLSKSLTDWIPQPFEPIWVWSNGETKRHRMLFAFFSEDGVFAFEEQFEKWSRFEVQEYKNFAKIEAPVNVPLSIAKYKFAQEYGVPASLIQIGQTYEL